MKELEREKEARRLKEFLEDYDDERDDPKYYKLVPGLRWVFWKRCINTCGCDCEIVLFCVYRFLCRFVR